jgi:DNA-binding NarL/FixJ family response regulator
MRKRRVAIIYANPLFAHGIACLLSEEPGVEIACLDASLQDTAEELRRWHPEVMIVEHDGERSTLDGVPGDRVGDDGLPLLIRVGLKDAGMELFYNRRIVAATPDTLRQAVLEDGSRRRRAPARKHLMLPP